MKTDLVKILKCPTCLSPLQAEASEVERIDEEIRTGNLRCACGAYPIDNYVPRFAGDRYATNFGRQWNLFRRTQLDRLAQDNSETRFASEIGFRLQEVAGRMVKAQQPLARPAAAVRGSTDLLPFSPEAQSPAGPWLSALAVLVALYPQTAAMAPIRRGLMASTV